MSLGDHLEELRRRILHALAGLVVGAGVGLAFARSIIDLLERSYVVAMAELGKDADLVVQGQTSGFTTYLGVAIVSGIVIASPWILYQLWRFVAAGLYPRERRAVMMAVPFSAALFVGGAVFFLLVASLPLMRFFARFDTQFLGVRRLIPLGVHIRFMMRMMLVFAVGFQTPLVVLVLHGVGLVSMKTLRHYRRHVVVGVLIFAALMTSPSPVDQIALAVPMWLLYELGILLAWIFGPKRHKTEG